ncbi:ribosome assembly RNA-binding protein YhbY [uncultured Desulfuromonas sp.]|uniref:ribosome assembly RNA-binding protein YhbY n=1 Tax=uncultured Desulfuromonas sp. TaxID=181013 RepID=UPI002614146A|nr:ribosome assembly RNA-binding protein YhbY [uncultured Desulfuromonas sp.]
MEKLSGKQARFLRGLGHHLKPCVMLGKEGLTESLVASVEEALEIHELIKIKIQEGCLLDRKDVAETLSQRMGAQVAQVLGRTILLYRRGIDPKIKLP